MRLATWNVLNGTGLSDGRVDGDRLAEAAGSLRADVLALQEVDSGQPRSRGLDLVRVVTEGTGARDGLFVPALVGTPGGAWRPATDDDDRTTPCGYGVGLVSAHPVRSWHVLRLAPAPVRSPVLLPGGGTRVLWLRDEPRVVVAAVVETPGGLLTAASTHLSFLPGWNAWQLRRTVRWLSALPGPRVLMGDLNLPAGPSRLASGWRPLGRLPTYPAPGPRVQLDHVLGSGELPAVLSVDAPVLPVSDHRPLVVELA